MTRDDIDLYLELLCLLENARLDVMMKNRRDRAVRKGCLLSLLASSVALAGIPVHAAQTAAGTTINNVAHVTYQLDNATTELASNNVAVRVDELIDLIVEPAPVCGGASTAAAGVVAIGFRITNKGNGREAFIPGEPEVTGDNDFKPQAVVEDSNRDGCYQPDIDRVIPPGGETSELDPGESITLFVVGSNWKGTGRVRIAIRSATGTGTTGTAILGAGDGGSDAVIGISGGAIADVPGTSPEAPAPLQASLVKTQKITAPDGSDRPVRGATITYSIEARFTGGGTASDVVIADSIPAGTDYVTGSMTVDAAAVSDAQDGDPAGYDGTRVSVALGNVPAPATRIISFKVKIK